MFTTGGSQEVAEGAEGGETADIGAVEKPWAPKDVQELLNAIATTNYGVSDDRSPQVTAPALKAYNNMLDAHGTSHGHRECWRGRTLPEGFVIVKVTAHHAHGECYSTPRMPAPLRLTVQTLSSRVPFLTLRHLKGSQRFLHL